MNRRGHAIASYLIGSGWAVWATIGKPTWLAVLVASAFVAVYMVAAEGARGQS